MKCFKVLKKKQFGGRLATEIVLTQCFHKMNWITFLLNFVSLLGSTNETVKESLSAFCQRTGARRKQLHSVLDLSEQDC